MTVSKTLSYLLRHAADREGLRMNAQGYANVADVVGDFDYSKRGVRLSNSMLILAIADLNMIAIISKAEIPQGYSPRNLQCG